MLDVRGLHNRCKNFEGKELSMDKRKIGKVIGISAAVLGTAFISASIVAKKKAWFYIP